METKDIVLAVVASIGALTGIGGATNETFFEADTEDHAKIERLEAEIEGLRTGVLVLRGQNCLLIAEIQNIKSPDQEADGLDCISRIE